MTYDPHVHHRRSVRLRGYDYASPGHYFLTVCAFRKQMLFGRIHEGRMARNDFGEIVQEQWFRSTVMRSGTRLDAFIVMPNHIHGIIQILDVGAHGVRPDRGRSAPPERGRILCAPTGPGNSRQRRPRSLATFVGGFKSAVTGNIRRLTRDPGRQVWQPNYYEHIVRDEDELNKIREYILTNPLRWAHDIENPERAADAVDELAGVLPGGLEV